VESTESVGAAVGSAAPGALVAGVAGVGDEALREARALPVAGAAADGDTPGDTARLVEGAGVGMLVVVAPGVPTGDAGLVGCVDFAFFVVFGDFDGFAECWAVALFVTTGAIAGARVPALLCQAKATEPPAGTLRASTPSEA
jgi:hypothetical protein